MRGLCYLSFCSLLFNVQRLWGFIMAAAGITEVLNMLQVGFVILSGFSAIFFGLIGVIRCLDIARIKRMENDHDKAIKRLEKEIAEVTVRFEKEITGVKEEQKEHTDRLYDKMTELEKSINGWHLEMVESYVKQDACSKRHG